MWAHAHARTHTPHRWWEGIFKYADGIGSGAMTYIPSFIMTDSHSKVERGNTQTQRHHGDCIRPCLLFQNKESRLNIKMKPDYLALNQRWKACDKRGIFCSISTCCLSIFPQETNKFRNQAWWAASMLQKTRKWDVMGSFIFFSTFTFKTEEMLLTRMIQLRLTKAISWRPIGLWDVKDPTLSRQSAHRWR
jgi:hypothetical protein